MGLDWVQVVVVSHDGKNVYVAGIGHIAVFSRDTSTGALTYVTKIAEGDTSGGKTVAGLNSGEEIVVSSDGKSVYVVTGNDNAVVVFSRDTSTGSLTYSKVFQKTGTTPAITGAEAVNGLQLAIGLTLSPDGKSVYATGGNDHTLVVFSRDTSTGALTYSKVFQDPGTTPAITGAEAAEGLRGAEAAVVSPDGKNVYVTGWSDDAIVVFSRNTNTGALTYVTKIAEGDTSGGKTVTGLDMVLEVVMSSDGKTVYVTSELSTLVVFDRDMNTGGLTYKTTIANGDTSGGKTVAGLSRGWGVVVSPDNNNVYVTGYLTDAIITFKRD